MQTPQAKPEHQPSDRVDTTKTNTIQQAAQWLRQTGLEDDNYDGKQWWEESDSESDIDFEISPERTTAVEDTGPATPATSVPCSDEEELPIEPQQAGASDPAPRRRSLRWHKHGYNAAYFGPIEVPDLMPAPLMVRKRRPAPKTPSPVSRKPVPNSNKPSSIFQSSRPEIDKPLPALPDMRVTGQMANGVKILSLAEAQAQHRLAGYEVPMTEQDLQHHHTEVVDTPQAPFRRGTTKRMGLASFARSTKTESTTSSASGGHLHPAPLEAAAASPTPRSPTIVGNPDRNTRWEDVMPHSPYEHPPNRPPPPPPIEQPKCTCPEHRAERAATYQIPRKPIASKHETAEPEEPVHSPSVQDEINRLEDRFQLSFDPDDNYDREPIVDTFVRADHTSIRITDRINPYTIVSHHGREERLDGDENFEKARAKLAAYFGA